MWTSSTTTSPRTTLSVSFAVP
uniref:Uncharacterized protein n=1 Tax=Timema genevievae TaxID=629358 RepID=A0A7R9KAE5_TIMGE|nr:unnamed protein product [Timema genevievae]